MKCRATRFRLSQPPAFLSAAPRAQEAAAALGPRTLFARVTSFSLPVYLCALLRFPDPFLSWSRPGPTSRHQRRAVYGGRDALRVSFSRCSCFFTDCRTGCSVEQQLLFSVGDKGVWLSLAKIARNRSFGSARAGMEGWRLQPYNCGSLGAGRATKQQALSQARSFLSSLSE